MSMLQTIATYLIVGVAAAWLAWRLVLPRPWQARLRTLIGRAPPSDGCACGRDR